MSISLPPLGWKILWWLMLIIWPYLWIFRLKSWNFLKYAWIENIFPKKYVFRYYGREGRDWGNFLALKFFQRHSIMIFRENFEDPRSRAFCYTYRGILSRVFIELLSKDYSLLRLGKPLKNFIHHVLYVSIFDTCSEIIFDRYTLCSPCNFTDLKPMTF